MKQGRLGTTHPLVSCKVVVEVDGEADIMCLPVLGRNEERLHAFIFFENLHIC